MVQLILTDVGHRFGRRKLFSGISHQASTGDVFGIAGPNGCGKSTLVQVIGGFLTPTKGNISLRLNEKEIDAFSRPLESFLAAPYAGVYEQMTGRQTINFVRKLADTKVNANPVLESLVDASGLADRLDEPVKVYSTGMKQRLKLLLACVRTAPVTLLDEPGSNLDDQGFSFVRLCVDHHRDNGCVVVIASNDARDLSLASSTSHVDQFPWV